MRWPISRRIAAAALLAVVMMACGGRDDEGGKDLGRWYLERVHQTKEEATDQEELVHFFDASWTAVAWEVLARRQLAEHLRGGRGGWVASPAETMDLIEAADREARQVFSQRFGLEPPDKYFPPLESEVSEAFRFGAAWQRVLWPQLLREAGLLRAADIPPYLERLERERRDKEDRRRQAEELAQARGISLDQAAEAVELGELLESFTEPDPVNMRELRHVYHLDQLAQLGFVEALTDGKEIHWRLTPTGKEALGRSSPADLGVTVALEPLLEFFPYHNVTAPLLRGRYFGLGRVTETGFGESLGLVTGQPEHGRRWIAVQMVAGVSFWQRPRFAGDFIPGVAEPGASIVGEPKAGDLVGYCEPRTGPDGDSEPVWEKINDGAD